MLTNQCQFIAVFFVKKIRAKDPLAVAKKYFTDVLFSHFLNLSWMYYTRIEKNVNQSLSH